MCNLLRFLFGGRRRPQDSGNSCELPSTWDVADFYLEFHSIATSGTRELRVFNRQDELQCAYDANSGPLEISLSSSNYEIVATTLPISDPVRISYDFFSCFRIDGGLAIGTEDFRVGLNTGATVSPEEELKHRNWTWKLDETDILLEIGATALEIACPDGENGCFSFKIIDTPTCQ